MPEALTESQRLKATKWVEALRSGNYPQTQGKLYRSDDGDVFTSVGYCCLGVLCDLDDNGEWDDDDHYRYPDHVGDGYMIYETEPPLAVRQSVGLPVELMHALVSANDGDEVCHEQTRDMMIKVGLYPGMTHSFQQIADVIEMQLLDV